MAVIGKDYAQLESVVLENRDSVLEACLSRSDECKYD
jgi:hypothetical protein